MFCVTDKKTLKTYLAEDDSEVGCIITGKMKIKDGGTKAASIAANMDYGDRYHTERYKIVRYREGYRNELPFVD